MIKGTDFKNTQSERTQAGKGTTGIRHSPGYGKSFIHNSKNSPAQKAPAQLQPAPAATASKTGVLTLTEFKQTVKRRFGIKKVSTGTFLNQMNIVTFHQAAIAGELDAATWQAWNPGSSSPVYQYIIQGFDELAVSIGGLPDVQEINFFEVCYEKDPDTSLSVKMPGVGADYGAGSLNIYKKATTANQALPVARSSGKQAAAIKAATPEQSMKRIITHELGHGLQEAAYKINPATKQPADKDLVASYGREVGWTTTGLYDIRETSGAVRQAIKDGNPPPAHFKITSGNWNDPKWQEQPVSEYMAKSAFEDFGEAVMAYVNDPKLLKDRSPLRYKFIDSHKSLWLPNLVQPKQ